MTTGNTKLTNLVDPQVMADMVSAGLPKAIKFTQFAKVDTTLTGVPGSTITIPAWAYIGDAKDVAEGAAIDLDQMTTSTKQAKVKKVAKGLELTDEAVLSGYGDPVGEAARQLTMAIASKVDEDIVAELGNATLTKTVAAKISYDGIVDAVDQFNEEETTEKYLFVHPKQVTELRKDPSFIDKEKYGNDVMMTGEIGMIAGCRLVVSRRVPSTGTTYDNFIVVTTAEPEDGTPVQPAISLFMKRDVAVETDRDIIHKSTVITADEHYVVKLTNDTKVLKVTFNA